MFAALLSFLGGSVFRMIFGEISSFLTKRQDHAHEVALLTLQAQLDDKRHARDMENIRLQAELKVQQIAVQSDADVAKGDADAFTEAMKNFGQPTGIWWVDSWNGSIRPAFATLCLGLWFAKLMVQDWKMDEFDISMMAVIVGFFFADRTLRRNGK